MSVHGSHLFLVVLQFCLLAAVCWYGGYAREACGWHGRGSVALPFLAIALVSTALYWLLQLGSTLLAVDIVFGFALFLRGNSQAYFDRLKVMSEQIPNKLPIKR